MSERPELHLYTAPTMNGWKPLLFLHEAGLDYELTAIDFDRREQKAPHYVRLNPNGRIPTLLDRAKGDFAVFESGAILWYLAEREGRFLEADPKVRSETLQWLFFQMAGVGPMLGQAMYFQRIARPKGIEVPFAIERYTAESRRLLEVLDRRLSDRDWLAGSAYSIADMATWTWAACHFWAGVSVEGLDGLQAWLDRIRARPATQVAITVPEARPHFFGEGDVEGGIASNAASFELPGTDPQAT